MTADNFVFIKYMNANASRFSYWCVFMHRTYMTNAKARKEVINFFTPLLGPLGTNWQYERNSVTFTLKLNNEADAIMMVLRYKKN